MKGSVQIDGGRQSVQANLVGGLLQSQVKANVAVNGFQDPAIRFDIDVDQFDADLYLPQKTAGVANKPAPAEQPLDLAALKKLNLEGGLRIGALKIANVKLSQVRLEVIAQNGLITISPLSTNMYQGSMNGSLKVNAQTTPHIAINQNLNGINIAPLLQDAANFDTLEGRRVNLI
jgi:AsmA protein